MTTRDATRRFIQDSELPRRSVPRGGAPAEDSIVEPTLQEGRNQAAVVGSEIVSFATGVPAEWRQDLMNGALLAQLVAKQQVPETGRIFEWYDVYFDTLAQLGWAVQDRGFSIFVEEGRDFSAHEAILKVAAAALGPATTALSLVTTTLDSLKAMDADSPWLTLFSRESRTTSAARFQLSVAERAGDQATSFTLMSFGLEARQSMTQVLFFKTVSGQATLRHCSGRMSVDMGLLADVRQDLKDKLSAHTRDFIRRLPDLKR
jgi:hypothetical protein